MCSKGLPIRKVWTPTLSPCRPDNVEQREAFKKIMSFLQGAVN